MENNRGAPNTSHENDNYNYSHYRNVPPMRPYVPPNGSFQRLSGKKTYYKDDIPENLYAENQLWKMQRRVPKSPQSIPPSQRQAMNQLTVQSQFQNSFGVANEKPLRGILSNRRNEIRSEGQPRAGNNAYPTRPKTPVSYRLPTYRSNENFVSSFSGGDPAESDDSQYYLLDEEKNKAENYDTERSMYQDFNVPINDGNRYKDHFPYDYNLPESEDVFYDPSIPEFASLDIRDKKDQGYQYVDKNYSYPDGTFENAEDNYYNFQSSIPGTSSQAFGRTRYQNQPRSGALTQSVNNRREIYKHVTDKLNETYSELKNAGMNEKKEGNRSILSPNRGTTERYTLQQHLETNKKPILKKAEYDFLKKEYFANKDSFTNRQLKYHDYANENSIKPTMLLSHLEKFKLDKNNEQNNPPSRYSSGNPESSFNIKRKMSAKNHSSLEDHNEGSFVHMHNEYKKQQTVPGCCVDSYHKFKKDKPASRDSRIE